jgi:hypothetical protein
MQTSAKDLQVMELDILNRCLFLSPKLMYSGGNDMGLQQQLIPPNHSLQTSQSGLPEIPPSTKSKSFSNPSNGYQQVGVSASSITTSTGISSTSNTTTTTVLQSTTEATPPFVDNISTHPAPTIELHACPYDHPFCNGSCMTPQADALTTHIKIARTLLKYDPSADLSTILSATNRAMKHMADSKRIGKLRQSTESPALSIESDTMADLQRRITFLLKH